VFVLGQHGDLEHRRRGHQRLELLIAPRAQQLPQLALLLGRQLHAGHLRLQCSVDGRDELSHLVQPGHDRGPLPAQVLADVGGRVVEQERDLLQREPEAPVHHDVLQAHHVVVGVEPVAGRAAAARAQQADLVVVVQRPHRHVEALGHLSHRQRGLGAGHLGHAPHRGA
jgi:hypothetical protein